MLAMTRHWCWCACLHAQKPIEAYLTFGKSDVIHSTILAFAQMAERRSTLRDLGSGGPRAEGVKGSSLQTQSFRMNGHAFSAARATYNFLSKVC